VRGAVCPRKIFAPPRVILRQVIVAGTGEMNDDDDDDGVGDVGWPRGVGGGRGCILLAAIVEELWLVERGVRGRTICRLDHCGIVG
jgi:hypothetical protein